MQKFALDRISTIWTLCLDEMTTVDMETPLSYVLINWNIGDNVSSSSLTKNYSINFIF